MEKKPFTNIDGYIAAQAATHQPLLKKLRETIRKAAPGGEEVISYSMPAYKFHGMLVYFAAHEKHIGFYAMKSTMHVFKDRIVGYQSGEATIRLALDKPIPVKLITDIVKFRAKENMDKKLMKEAAKTKK
jgi:uncharacterized protein YdhG (YjbR/CyaY superfamily)